MSAEQPPQGTVVNLDPASFVNGPPTFSAPVLRVTDPGQLPAALGQKERSVVIEVPSLQRRFSQVAFWQGTQGTIRFGASLVAALLALALALQYGLDIHWAQDWKILKTDLNVTLTPKR
ncbi:hypothetical protein [Bradyrhizobium diazoefficiens]|uniref:hypothetical protein n=1 Tax=Bradyrhizobium diazoefficiens TaxID=1355477 RepID=UPI00346AFA51